MAVPLGNTIVSAVQVGNKTLVTFDHSGPASYSQANGDVINAADLGFGGFEMLQGGADSAAKFEAECVDNLGGFGNAVPSYILRWWNLTTATVGGQSQTLGTEATIATNLSTFSIRLQAWCV